MELPDKSGQIHQNDHFDQAEASSVTDEEAQMLQKVADQIALDAKIPPGAKVELNRAARETSDRQELARKTLYSFLSRN